MYRFKMILIFRNMINTFFNIFFANFKIFILFIYKHLKIYLQTYRFISILRDTLNICFPLVLVSFDQISLYFLKIWIEIYFFYFSITPPKPLEGSLAVNTLLEKAEKLFEGKISGPESFTDYNGELYMSVLGGQVLKYNPQQDKLSLVVSFSSEKCQGYHTEPECGRPLGLKFDNNGNLIVIEAYSGIWKVDVKTGKKQLLISKKDEIDGKPINLPNGLAIAKNGDIYWTDSSSDYELRDIIYALIADGTGR